MADQTSTTQLVVIGGGPGGYAAAFLAADLGMKVALVDNEANPGGTCLYRGCIPSKALLHAARVLSESKEAAHFGIEFQPPRIDTNRLRTWKEEVVNRLTGGLGQISKQRKVEYIQGSASLIDPKTISIASNGSPERRLSFEHAILATGSIPAMLPGLPKSERIIDSTGALDLADVPKTLLVVGGGYIGLELGTVYAALGTQVEVVEMLDGLLPGADRDLVTPLAKRIEKVFHKVMLNT